MTSETRVVQSADNSSDTPATGSQLVELLKSLGLPVGQASNDVGAFDPGSEDFQALKAGVTKASAWITKLLAGAGGIGTVAGAVGAYLAKQGSGMQIALVLSAAGILAAAVVSIAIVLSADLRARSHATAAQYQALGRIVAAVESAHVTTAAQPDAPLRSSPEGSSDPVANDLATSLLAIAATGRRVRARISQTDEYLYITGVRYESNRLRVRMSPDPASNAGSWYGLPEIDEFNTTL